MRPATLATEGWPASAKPDDQHGPCAHHPPPVGILPSFLTSTCTIAPGCTCSYRTTRICSPVGGSRSRK